MKNSSVKALRQRLQQSYGLDQELVDLIIPASKKSPVVICKCNMLNVSLLLVRNDDTDKMVFEKDEFLFWNHFDGEWMPTLRLLHKFPQLLKHVQIDKGAIKFIVGGAPIMCVGLTSKGGRLPEEDLPIGEFVAVMAEGKQHACAIGQLTKSISEIKSVNKDTGINNMHYLGDDLYLNYKLN